MKHQNPSDDGLKTILRTARTIALVGASSNANKPSHQIMCILLDAGYRVIPVNPNEQTILGQPVFKSLDDIREHIDIIDVFRRAEDTLAIAEAAVRIGADVLWLQQGIVNESAAECASQGGVKVVMDACTGALVRIWRINVGAASSGA